MVIGEYTVSYTQSVMMLYLLIIMVVMFKIRKCRDEFYILSLVLYICFMNIVFSSCLP